MDIFTHDHKSYVAGCCSTCVCLVAGPLFCFSSLSLSIILQVVFKTPVSIADNPKINQWLSLVEKEMRLNLAMLLAQAVDGIAKFSKGTINTEQYLQWVDSYQAQLVVLASQVTWSTNVESALQTLQAQASPGELAPMNEVLGVIEGTLNVLADCVLHEQPPVRRKKLEHLVSRGDKTAHHKIYKTSSMILL